MLNRQYHLSRKTFAVVLTLVVLNSYVLMGATTTRASSNTSAEESLSSNLLVGRLGLADQQAIYINGNEAGNGTSIFSGTRLQSPVGVNAVVQLGSIGMISLEQETDLTLEFSRGHIAINIAAGNATLTTSDGVEATLTLPDGRVMKSEGNRAAVLSTMPPKPAPKLSKGKKAAAIIIPIVAVIVIVAIIVATNDDDSPSTP